MWFHPVGYNAGFGSAVGAIVRDLVHAIGQSMEPDSNLIEIG
jgi:hypothetical protein